MITTFFLVCLAFLLGIWGETAQKCNTYGGLITIILIIPTWFVLVSLDSIGTIPALLVRLIPTYYFAKTIVYSLSGSATLETVDLNLLILSVFTAVTFLALVWQLKKRPLWYA